MALALVAADELREHGCRAHAGPLVAPASQRVGKNKGKRHPDTYDGRWRDYYAAKGKRMPGWCRRAGISRHVRFHDLRHTCASHLVMGTWMPALSLYEVRDWMGHSSVQVTQKYAHLAPEGLREKVRRARKKES